MRNLSFFSVLALLVVSTIALSYAALSLFHVHPHSDFIFLFHGVSVFSHFMLSGIGLGLPLTFIAAVLGWGQLALLLKGNIRPHLAREGFLDVLKILFSKI